MNNEKKKVEKTKHTICVQTKCQNAKVKIIAQTVERTDLNRPCVRVSIVSHLDPLEPHFDIYVSRDNEFTIEYFKNAKIAKKFVTPIDTNFLSRRIYITSSTKGISMVTAFGEIKVRTSTDIDYPGIRVEYISNDGQSNITTIPSVLIEKPHGENHIRALVWSDQHCQDFTDKFVIL